MKLREGGDFMHVLKHHLYCPLFIPQEEFFLVSILIIAILMRIFHFCFFFWEYCACHKDSSLFTLKYILRISIRITSHTARKLVAKHNCINGSIIICRRCIPRNPWFEANYLENRDKLLVLISLKNLNQVPHLFGTRQISFHMKLLFVLWQFYGFVSANVLTFPNPSCSQIQLIHTYAYTV